VRAVRAFGVEGAGVLMAFWGGKHLSRKEERPMRIDEARRLYEQEQQEFEQQRAREQRDALALTERLSIAEAEQDGWPRPLDGIDRELLRSWGILA
jgi:hypothetical protein